MVVNSRVRWVGPGAALLGLGMTSACSSAAPPPPEPTPFFEVYAEDFRGRAGVQGWAYSDPRAWEWSDRDGRPSLRLVGESEYHPPHRSPLNIALVPNLLVGDFDLEVELRQTGRDYGHRDLCVFFGFQSPARYYYVHLAQAPDENAHNVFLVDEAPRRNLAPVASAGIEWGEDRWHHVRIERRLETGAVRVFWDHGDEPILTATDTTLGGGRIGFGSFDDTGWVTDIEVRAPRATVFSGPSDPFR